MKTFFISIFLVGLLFFSNLTTAQTEGLPTSTLVSELNLPAGLTNYLALSFDTKKLAYATRLPNSVQYSFYFRERGANSWNAEKDIPAINSLLTPETQIGGLGFNYNASVLYFSLDAKDGNGMDIYFTEWINNQWSDAQKFDASINSTENESDPCISADGNSFYFVRNNLEENEFSESFECKIIFVSEKINQKWTKPFRMPGQINSGCVCSPRISSDNQTLYFSAVVNKDFAFDVYQTQMVAKGIWSDPTRVEIISNDDSNIYPNITFDGKEIYCINQSKKNTKKETNQIYKAPLAKGLAPKKCAILKGKILNLENEKPLQASINVINPFTSKIISTYTNDAKTGEYNFFLNSQTHYRIEYWQEGYSHDISQIEIPTLDSNKIFEKTIKLYSNASLVLNVFDQENFQPLAAKVQVLEVESGNILNIEPKEIFAGRYKMLLPLGKNYKILASKLNYVTDTLLFDLKKVIQFDEFEKDVELAILKRDFVINLKDGQTDAPINSEIVVVNKTRKETFYFKGNLDEPGKYKMQLREGDEYEINVLSREGYAYYNTAINLEKEPEKLMDIGLMPLNADANLKLNNIVFETNSDQLTAFSFIELDRLVELLAKNPRLKVEVSAHTDNVGSDAYNTKLSERRAQSVVNYLTEKGIKPEALIAKGYGESKPIAANDTDENKALNRRVEMSILEVTEKTSQE